MTVKITIADYGVGNLLNVARAFQHCGADVHITENPAEIAGAERLVVPRRRRLRGQHQRTDAARLRRRNQTLCGIGAPAVRDLCRHADAV